jgi:membrane protease YdiL (CAAX protease family)
MLAYAALSAVLNFFVFAGIPLLLYAVYQRWRHQLPFREIADRAGLRAGSLRYINYGVATAFLLVALILLWHPPLAPLLRPGSAERVFRGVSLNIAIPMALLYGVVQSGLTEEILFRGLIAGSLGRRLPMVWANVLQGAIFLLPHLMILRLMPDMWGMLLVIFVLALIAGWFRIKSGSILAGWIIHTSVNVTMCLSVAIRTS